MTFQIGFCQDSTKRFELNTVEITAPKPVPHILTNYKKRISINKWSVDNYESDGVKQNLCFLTRIAIPNRIYINEISFKIPYTDTITHTLNCIIIQDERIIFKKRITTKSKFLNKQLHIDSVRGLVVQKGSFYIGVVFSDKCTNCTFHQKLIPNFGKNNFIGTMPERATTKEFNTANLTKIKEGVQYKIIYNKDDGM